MWGSPPNRYIGEEELDEGEIMMMMDNKELLKEKLVDNDFFNGACPCPVYEGVFFGDYVPSVCTQTVF